MVSAAFAALATSAFAADLPMRTKAPPLAAPVLSWTGFYAGLNAGYNWGDDVRMDSAVTDPGYPHRIDTETAPHLAAIGAAIGGARSNGFIGGAQVGYNWQFNNMVAGIETDIQWLASRSKTGIGAVGPPSIRATT